MEDNSMLLHHKKKKKNDSEINCWLALPDHLLCLFAIKLTFINDYISFGAVCKSWQTSYIENRRCLPRQVPLLMLPTQLNKDDQTRSFYSLTDKRVYNFHVRVPHNKVCFGSSHGWLVTRCIGDYKVSLLNLFSSVHKEIQLPTFPRIASWHKAVLSANPISNPNYIVMAIYGDYSRLVFFRRGNSIWNYLDKQCSEICDVINCKDKFLAVKEDGQVFACDVRNYPPSVSMVAPSHKINGQKYLVESSGELLQIVKKVEHYEHGDSPLDFVVFKLNPDGSNWIEVKSLGGRVLFIGNNASLSVSLSNFPGCKPNSIYFTNSKHPGHNDMGVFNIEDGSFEPHYPIESNMSITPSPIWIEPTL